MSKTTKNKSSQDISTKHKIAILGSINMDLVAHCVRAPLAGETILASDFSEIQGGKGANVALALARIKERPTMLGMVGSDGYASTLLKTLEGVDLSHIEHSPGSSGVALITLESDGENRIVVVGGANAKVDNTYVERHRAAIEGASLLISQMELAESTVYAGFVMAKAANTITLLNYAPAIPLREPLLSITDILAVNERELNVLCEGLPLDGVVASCLASGKGVDLICKDGQHEGILGMANALLNRYSNVKALLITLGSSGALYCDRSKAIGVSAYAATPLDTTGAGDCFIAGFTKGLLDGYVYGACKDTSTMQADDSGIDTLCNDLAHSNLNSEHIASALDFAAAAASISVEHVGASSSFPSLEGVLARIG